MKAFFGLLLVGFAALLLAGCQQSEQDKANQAAAEADLKSLEGKWKFASQDLTTEEEDEDAPEAAKEGYYYIIEKNMLRVEYKDKDGKAQPVFYRKLTILPGKSPKAVDLIHVDKDGKEQTLRTSKKGLTGKKRTTTTVQKDVAIFKVEGNKLELCVSWDEKKRPTDFTAGAKSRRYVVKLEKVTD